MAKKGNQEIKGKNREKVSKHKRRERKGEKNNLFFIKNEYLDCEPCVSSSSSSS